MNRALLEKPFEPEQIKQREGSFGKMFSEALENVDDKQIEGIQSTGAKPNGRIRVWVDNVLQFEFDNVRFNATKDAMFRGIDIDPVWGGRGDRKTQTDYLYFDHVIMAGSNEKQE